jgi:hypothetical protein
MFTCVAETRSSGARAARRVRAGAGLQIVKRLILLIAMALVGGPTSAAEKTEHPITYVYVLLGGLAGADGYVDSNGLLLLAGRIANIPNTWVEIYPWRDWVTAANRVWARSSKDARVAVVAYSGGGSRATWLANSVLHKSIDLIVTYDPSPKWQMQNLPPNVKKAITFENQIPFIFGLGGGELTGPNVQHFLIREEHLLVQFDERLHQITLQAIEDLAK